MKIATLTALALVLGSAPLVAQTPEAGPGRMPIASFAEIDTDGDGRITPEEWAAHLGARMNDLRSERLGAHADALIEAGDADGDGRLDRTELIAALDAVATERREAMAEQRGSRHGMRHEMRHERRGEMRGERRGEMRSGWQGRRDGDQRARPGDARRGDSAGFAERSFSRIDTDRDGAISAEEYAAAVERMEQMRERRAQRPGRRN